MNKNKNRDLIYIEADLPGMAMLKKDKFKKAGHSDDRHLVIPCDILSENGDLSIENIAKKYLKPGVPAVIITEGLINYFDMETLKQIWKRISNLLALCNGGVYLSDNLAHKTDHQYYFLVKIWTKMVGLIARGKFHMHFYSDREAEETFKSIGFRELNVHHPETYRGILPIFLSAKPSFINVIEGIV